MNAYRLPAYLLLLPLAGCALPGARPAPEGVQGREFELGYLAKSDVDLVTETHQRSAFEALKGLGGLLYACNPQHLTRSGFMGVEQAMQRIFDPQRTESFPQLQGRTSIDAIRLAFAPEYTGDRVLALVEGLRSMILLAYENKTRFFILDQLDPQKIHYSARNVEAAAWLLANSRDTRGAPLLSSAQCTLPNGQATAERLIGRLIGIQDNLAQIVADSTNRQIKNVIQTVASMVFFPI